MWVPLRRQMTSSLTASEVLTKNTLKCTFKCMEYITTTSLRTQSSQLVKALQQGSTVTLIHRSKVIGVIDPAKPELKQFDAEGFKEALQGLKIGHTTYEEREKIYRKHIEEKYGKNLS